MAVSSIPKNLNLSIVIVSYNDAEILTGCLNSIYEHSHGIDFEIIVVNNARLPSINFKKQFPDIHWIENKQNFGFARAVNQGIGAAKAEYILCLNSDTVLTSTSLEPLIKFMNKYQRAGAVGGRVLNQEGIIQPTCRRFPTYLNGVFNRSSFLTKLFPDNRFSRRYLLTHWNHKNIRRVDWIAGTYILFRQAAIQDVGYLDEDYFMYCEEIDWCFRAKQNGWKVYYVPEAGLIHRQNNHIFMKEKIVLHHKSMFKFYKKHLKGHLIIQVFMTTVVFLKVAVLRLLYVWGKTNVKLPNNHFL